DHLARSQRVWRVIQQVAANQPKVHAGATALITRRPVRVGLVQIPKVTVNISMIGPASDSVKMSVSAIEMEATRLFWLPDTILYWQKGVFASIPYETLTVTQGTTRFVENDAVPNDSKVVGQRW